MADARNRGRRWMRVTRRAAGKVKRLFNGSVAAADDGDVTSGELCTVAFRAGAYAVAELSFAGHVEGPGDRAHGKDQGTAVV